MSIELSTQSLPTTGQLIEQQRSAVAVEAKGALEQAAWQMTGESGLVTPTAPEHVAARREAFDKINGLLTIGTAAMRLGVLLANERNGAVKNFPLAVAFDEADRINLDQVIEEFPDNWGENYKRVRQREMTSYTLNTPRLTTNGEVIIESVTTPFLKMRRKPTDGQPSQLFMLVDRAMTLHGPQAPEVREIARSIWRVPAQQ